jgi:hypothetical protein
MKRKTVENKIKCIPRPITTNTKPEAAVQLVFTSLNTFPTHLQFTNFPRPSPPHTVFTLPITHM